MQPDPWVAPELVQLGRLPIHSVPHTDRLELDGRWRFQLLPRPDASPGDDWAEITVPGAWTMQGFADLPHYTNVQMPFEGNPPNVPEANPTGIYERTFELPATWAGRRVVLHVGAAESVLIVRLNDRDVGVSKDSHLAAEFDLTDLVRPGIEHAQPAGREVVRRDVRRGPGPVVARRDHPVGVPLRDRGRSTSPTSGRSRVSPTISRPGRSTSACSSASRATTLEPGWAVEARLEGVAEPFRADARSVDRRSLMGWTLADQRLLYSRAAGLPLSATDEAGWSAMYGRMAPPLDGSVGWRIEVPGVDRWSAEEPRLYCADGDPAGAERHRRRGGRAAGRLPPGARSSGSTC